MIWVGIAIAIILACLVVVIDEAAGNLVEEISAIATALEEDSMKLTDEAVIALKARASRGFSTDIPVDKLDIYQAGLKDGETMTAQYVLGELKEETE